MCQAIATEKVGARVYVTGNSFPVKNQLKSAGCHWDADRRQWWIGAVKASAIESIIAAPTGRASVAAPAKEDLSEARVLGKADYKGRSYYVLAETRDGQRLRLTVLNGSIVFWAQASACTWTKHYQPREVWDGRYYSGRTQTHYRTLGSIQRFVSQLKDAGNPHIPEGGYLRDGEVLMRGCGECSRLGHMCRECEFDEYDN